MSDISRWILLAPLGILGLGILLFFSTENEIRVQFDRAQEFWRDGQVDQAAEGFQAVVKEYPGSLYAPRSLWELGTLSHVNRYDVSRAVEYFQQLVHGYPESPLAGEAMLRLAEIHALELQDHSEAVHWWRRYLQTFPGSPNRRSVWFQLGNAYFQQAQLREARVAFQEVLGAQRRTNDDLSHKANLRIATICQLERDYEASVHYFEDALESEDCAECRLQAQLGLIESLEFLGELPRAIEVAGNIDAGEFSWALKRDLVSRLNEKMKYYDPRLWKKTP